MRWILAATVVAVSVLVGGMPFASAAEKAYLGTVIAVDLEKKEMQVITNDGKIIDVVAEDKAAKHLDKIPLNTMIDIKVEVPEKGKPTVKSWTMTQAKSPCRIFDGKMCTP